MDSRIDSKLHEMVRDGVNLKDITAEELIHLLNSDKVTPAMYIAIEQEYVRRLVVGNKQNKDNGSN